MIGPLRRIVWLALVALTTPARAGDLRGAVGIRPSGGEQAGPLADAVVMLHGPTVVAPPGTRVVVTQRDHAFWPPVTVVTAGTTVDFANEDPVLHDVNSASPAKPFDIGLFDRGATRSVTFDTPGIVELRCTVHPRMRGIVVVHANPYAAVTDADGHYLIRDIPGGVYAAEVWHDGFVTRRVDASVPSHGLGQLDVQLERAP